MRILSVLTCCVGLALFAGAAQPEDQDNNQGKKKGGGHAQSQQVAAQPTTAPAKIKGGHHNANPNFQQPATVGGNYKATGKHAKGWDGKVTGQTQTNLSGQTNLPAVQSTAKGTTFNKTVNKNITVNKNFKVQKFNLGNQPSGKYQAVKFNQSYKIAGAQKWKGAKYQVFVNYQPQWHDQWWWTSHHNHIVFVFGSPYYWDAGYWYPAWGYDPGASYYYDGPIYASNPEMDPGQTVANVQSALQQQGYYQGEIDGVLGPQTRAALAEYQSAQGLEPTGAVDEPTLETLGMV
jgi:hypothetical protein